jgi:hypothetical protein
MPRWSSRIFILPIILALAPAVAFCHTINLGLISLAGDLASGGFALPQDFPATDLLTFLSRSLPPMGGGSPLVIPLGDLGPGALNPIDPVQFPDTSLFTEAIFTATLNQTGFLLSHGTTSVVGSSSISTAILPSSGASLEPGKVHLASWLTLPPAGSLFFGGAAAGCAVQSLQPGCICKRSI